MPTSSSSSAARSRRAALALAASREPVGDLRADRAARVERGVRVLEDHLQPGRALRPCAAAERRERRARRTGSRPPPARHEADGGAGERRLAAARLADEADDLPAVDGEARAGDGAQSARAAAAVDDVQVVNLRAGSAARPREGSGGQASSRVSRRRRAAARSRHAPARVRRSADGRRSPDGRSRGRRRRARGSPELSPALRPRGAAARRAARACTDGAARSSSSRVGPDSTIRPA